MDRTAQPDDAREQGTAPAPARGPRRGRLSRRDFLVRAAAFGLSGSALSAFIAACGPESPTATGPAAVQTTPAATAAAPAVSPTRPASPGTGAGASPTRPASPPPVAGASPTRPSASPVASPAAFSRDRPPAVANAAQARQYTGQRVTYIGGQVGSDADFDQILTRKFTEDTGIQVNVVPGPPSATERYAQYQRTFQGQSADIDALMVDVIWPAALAPHLVDLGPKLGDLARQAFPGIIENNTVDGKLVGLPWFGDFGILYYRTDLLQKYNISAPPKTWQELQQQAQQIQAGERGANPNFAGFVFQGNAYEGLTCNTLEWLASSGGGKIVEGGRVTINNPQAVQMMNTVKGWVGTISPSGVTTFQEDQTAQAFTSGNAAFARNWPYMYTIGNGADSQVRGKFDVTSLPTAQGQKPVGTLGGWQIGVSRYSRAQDAAIEFVRYMCGPDVVTWRAVVGTYVPLYPAVANNPAVQQNQPYLAKLADVERVARPSNDLGENYNEGSTAIYQAANQILTGGDAAQQLQQAQQRLERLLRRR